MLMTGVATQCLILNVKMSFYVDKLSKQILFSFNFKVFSAAYYIMSLFQFII